MALSVEEVKGIVNVLARSQGSYGRLSATLDESDRWEEFTEALSEADCKDAVDLVMYVEGF